MLLITFNTSVLGNYFIDKYCQILSFLLLNDVSYKIKIYNI